jgi:hypothetical protein
MTTKTAGPIAHDRGGRRKAAVLIPLVAAVVSLSGCGRETTAAAPVSDGAAVCPQSRGTEWQPGVPTRTGELVPADPTAAKLCVYPLPAVGNTAQLTRSVDAADPSRVSAYLNSLSKKVPSNHMCSPVGRTQYTVVLEYMNGHAVVLVGCGVEYAGAVRREFDLRTLLGFWNTTLEG